MAESRVRNTNRNILGGIVNRIVMLLLPFIVRTAIIKIFGAEYLGLNSLFSAILNVLSLAELGFGSAMVFSMYKPIAENNVEEVSALLNLYRKIYRIIGSFILIVGLALLPFLDHLIKGTPPEGMNIHILYVIFLSGTVLSYFLYAYKSSILTAAQHGYVMTNISSVLAIVQELIKLAVVLIFKDFYLYCLVALPFTVINNLIINYVVKRDYPQYQCYGSLDKGTLTDIKKRVTGLFMYKICYVFRDMFGSIVVSAFIGLAVLGEYNNYMYIYTSVAGILNLLRTSMRLQAVPLPVHLLGYVVCREHAQPVSTLHHCVDRQGLSARQSDDGRLVRRVLLGQQLRYVHDLPPCCRPVVARPLPSRCRVDSKRDFVSGTGQAVGCSRCCLVILLLQVRH